MKQFTLIVFFLITCQSCMVYTQKMDLSELPMKALDTEQTLQRIVKKRKKSKIVFEQEGKITKQKFVVIKFEDGAYTGIKKNKEYSYKPELLVKIEPEEIKKVKTINPGLSILGSTGGVLVSQFGLTVIVIIASGGYSL